MTQTANAVPADIAENCATENATDSAEIDGALIEEVSIDGLCGVY